MIYSEYKDITNFLEDTEEHFVKHEAVANLMYGVALRLKDNLFEYGSKPFMATVKDEGIIKLIALMTPPYKLQIINTQKDCDVETIKLLADKVSDEKWSIPAVIGELNLAESFANRWSRITGRQHSIGMKQRIHVLYSINKTLVPPGRFRPSKIEELDTILRWNR